MPDLEARKVIELGYGGNERLVMNMGPQHPSAHGVFRMILTLEGETIAALDSVIGYLHRCQWRARQPKWRRYLYVWRSPTNSRDGIVRIQRDERISSRSVAFIHRLL